jgi:hypothetical protein
VGAPHALGRFFSERGALRGRVDEVGEEDRGGPGRPFGRLGSASLATYFACALRGKDDLWSEAVLFPAY